MDPSVKQVIASARDETCSRYTPMDETRVKTSRLEQPYATSEVVVNGIVSHETRLSNGSPDERKQLYTGVSCLYPWRWAELRSHASSFWHPLRHAAVAAIEYSAARDRRLFPDSGQIGDPSNQPHCTLSASISSKAKRQKTDLEKVTFFPYPFIEHIGHYINICLTIETKKCFVFVFENCFLFLNLRRRQKR